MNQKIGLVVMFRISDPGGAPSVIVNAIRALNKMGKDVYLLTPFELNYDKIKELYGKIEIKKTYYPSKLKSVICKTNFLPRRFMKKEFQKMAKDVDLIVDIDGGFVHNYLTNKTYNKYIIWRFSCVKLYSDSDWSFKRKLMERIKMLLGARMLTIPSSNHKIYAVDEWTGREMRKYYNLDTENIRLYPVIRVEDFFSDNIKKNQISVFGRISPHKLIEDSIKIFAKGTANYNDYELVIFGAATADTPEYLNKLNKLINDLRIESRVKIIQNPLFEDLKKILSESKIIIDSQREVSNTLTTIEAMSSGNIILIHRNSGCFTEVLKNGELGFGFENVEEGGRVLSEVLNKVDNIETKDLVERSKDFSEDNFIKRLNQIIMEN